MDILKVCRRIVFDSPSEFFIKDGSKDKTDRYTAILTPVTTYL